MTHIEQSGDQQLSRRLSIAWAGAGIALLLPLVAMPFTNEVQWTGSDFLIAGLLLFGPLGLYTWVKRSGASTAYRVGLGMALSAVVLTLWAIGAVGITDTAADGLYVGALALGGIGAGVARGRARGMAWAMAGTAVALLAVGSGAVATGSIAPHNAPLEMMAATGMLALLFAGSALAFCRSVTE